MTDGAALSGRVLIVAGSDSGGGAGIQADIKTVTALGGFAATAVTALTAQNTEGVFGVYPVPPEFIAQQMHVVLDDIGADALKLGMLHNADVIRAVVGVIGGLRDTPQVIVDPVMFAKGGHALLEPAAMDCLRQELLPCADVVTPNIPEAEAISELTIATVDEMKTAAERIAGLGPRAVLLKGGHLDGDVLTDVLFADGRIDCFSDDRIETRHTHGTGCTLASALAAGLAQGMSLRDAVVRARAYVRTAILTAPGFGRGHGPLNHAHTVAPFGPGG
jgi:hydroxymethylpyrimidine/phosphomethylpyrimidine kinase